MKDTTASLRSDPFGLGRNGVRLGAESVCDFGGIRSGADVSGVLHTQDGSSPSHFFVRLLPQTGTYWPQGYSWDWVWTAADGSWTWQGVPPGRYKVQFQSFSGGTQLDCYYPGVFEEESATVLDLPAASQTAIEATLITGATISGYATNGQNGVGVDTSEAVYRLDPTTNQWSLYASAPWINLNGYYSIGRLPTGTYRVEAQGTGWRTGYSPDATSLGEANDIEVAAGQTARADVVVYPLEQISGSVSSELKGRRIGPILFSLWVKDAEEWSLVATQTPTSWGSGSASFDFEGMDVGTYRVTAEDRFNEYLSLGPSSNSGTTDDIAIARGDRKTVSFLLSPAHLWAPLVSGTSNALCGVDFPDISHGWAVGTYGTIVHSSDMGRTWTVQDSHTEQLLSAVDFVDDLHGWVAGDSGLVLRTADGGVTWTTHDIGVDVRLSGVCFADELHGWVIGGGRVYATTDAGDSWHHQPSPGVSGIACADASHAWIVGQGAAYSTADGGDTWVAHDNGTDRGQVAMAYAGGSKVWSVGGLDNVLLSEDGGETWARQHVPDASVYPASVSAPDPQHAFVAGPHQVKRSPGIYVTEDGGVSWYEASLPVHFEPSGVSAPDAEHVWAVGSGGTIAVWSPGDIVPPVTTAALSPAPNPAGWEKTDVLVGLSATDNLHGSGVAASEIFIDGVGPYVGPAAWLLNDGVHQVAFGSIDASGNLEGTQTITVKLDKTAPSTTDNAGGRYVSSATILLSPSDALSGVASTRYVLDGVPGTGTTVSTKVAGAHTLSYRSTDAAGNSESTHTVFFYVVPKVATRLGLAAVKSVKAKRPCKVAGSVSPAAAGGKVVLTFSRAVGRKWKSAGSLSISPRGGRFSCSFKPRYKGNWRVRASYSGRAGANAAYLAAAPVTRHFKVK